MILVKKLKKYYSNLQDSPCKPIYRIEDVDKHKKILNIMVVGTRIKLTYNAEDVFRNIIVIRGLGSLEACQLGVYCGEAGLGKAMNEKNLRKTSGFKKTVSRFSLLREERGMLRYTDKIVKKSYLEDPLSIVLNEFSISNFPSEQSFYIGFLAGKKMSKLGKDLSDEKMLRQYKYNRVFKLIK